MTASHLLGIVSWDPVLTGYLAVIIGIAVLCGSVYLLLATNLGVRLGFLVAWTGLWGWMLLMSIVWWVFGIGWIGSQPGWNVLQVTSNPATVLVDEVQQLGVDPDAQPPPGWIEIVVEEKSDDDAEEIVDPEIVEAQAFAADARSAADGHVVCDGADPRRLLAVNSCLFSAADEYKTYRVLIRGGERYRPLSIPDNAVTQYFLPSRGRPHYAVVQIQPYLPRVEIDPNVFGDDGKIVVPDPQIDENEPVYSVVLVRDHGSVRLRPALLTIFSALLFGLGCYHLHRRDQAIWAVREAAGQ
ncbi:MAG: hypothetical protein OXH86_16625 [Acidimicrobiaceae bacterium]|nr:hypothetical protein [Acidimicrobiaceae bacterium]MDE0498970.1 hypothetical protein [Acidimicrobiaceae bacterium]